MTLCPPADAGSPLPEGDALDALIFTRIIAMAANGSRPLDVETGLTRDQLTALIGRYAPSYAGLLDALPCGDGCGPAYAAIEEADLREFIAEYRGHDGEAATWLAAILARRTLELNHLWQDMGFANRHELNAMFERHFPALRALNAEDMKWKKFFYRQLCTREGLMLCKSPNCEICGDYHDCFGEESGDPLATLARLGRPAEASQA